MSASLQVCGLKCFNFLWPGDQIAHLWWRLLHGQMSKVYMPKVAIVLIGTNDLFAEADCLANNETALEDSVSKIFKRWGWHALPSTFLA